MAKVRIYVRLFYSLFTVLRRPEKTQQVFVLADALCELGAVSWARRRLEQSGQAGNVIRERKLLAKIDLDRLLRCPPESLGHKFAQHMRSLGLDPEFYPKNAMQNDDQYLLMRMRQTHDLWHVVTGLGTDVPGELALQAFVLSYIGLPLAALFVGGGFLRSTLKGGEKIADQVQAMNTGVGLALSVRGLFAYDWEANWDKPLNDVRREVCLHPELTPPNQDRHNHAHA
jgi:ubiquinone biosynthesis protein COQ4